MTKQEDREMKIVGITLIVFTFILALSGFASAIPTYTQGQTIQLTATCDNCTQVNLTRVTYPNGSLALLGALPMTKNGTNYNYTFTKTNSLGTYTYVTCGDLDGILTCEDTTDRTFIITGTGIEFTTANSLFYIALLCLLIFIFVLNIFGIAKLPHGNPRTDQGNIISISWLKYLKPALFVTAWGLVISILFISSSISGAYLGSNGFSSFLFGFYKISTFLIYPFLILSFAYMVLMFFRDVKIKQYLDRGYQPE